MQDDARTEPTLSTIEHAVQRQLGLTTPLHTSRVTEGGEHAVWYVGEHYIFRALPQSQSAALRKEAGVRDLVRKSQDDPMLVPELLNTIMVDDWIGNLDLCVKGASLEARHATHKAEADLVRFVKGLWSTPVTEAAVIVGNEEETVEFDDLMPRAHQAWDQLLESGHTIDREKSLVNLLKISESARRPSQSEVCVLLYNDFKGEHIILQTSNDEKDGTLAGVIDWSDAAIGDVAVDVGGLAISVGQRMAKRIALEAGVSHSAVERGITMARCDSVINLNATVNGDDRDSPEWLLRRQFRRVFEGTSLETALI